MPYSRGAVKRVENKKTAPRLTDKIRPLDSVVKGIIYLSSALVVLLVKALSNFTIFAQEHACDKS